MGEFLFGPILLGLSTPIVLGTERSAVYVGEGGPLPLRLGSYVVTKTITSAWRVMRIRI